jgi:hypothetical protein
MSAVQEEAPACLEATYWFGYPKYSEVHESANSVAVVARRVLEEIKVANPSLPFTASACLLELQRTLCGLERELSFERREGLIRKEIYRNLVRAGACP